MCGRQKSKKKEECVSKLTLDAVWKFGGSSSNIDPVSSVTQKCISGKPWIFSTF
jgi:hypothetical protein